MFRNYLKVALIVVLIINIAGCAELRRKFIRKKKPGKPEYSFYHPEEYRPRPPAERYQEHYVLWHNWHIDMARIEDTSHSRDMRALDESLRHLTAMRDLLVDEKAQELDIQIKRLEEVKERLKNTKEDVMKDIHSRRVVERVERIIINEFTYNRMKSYIKGESPELIEKESEGQ